MVADAVLWGLFAVAIAFIWWGCHNTRQTPNVSEPISENTSLDRAA
jgi:hypothetical protein